MGQAMTAMLGQAAVPRLPAPPRLEHWLLEAPTFPAVVLAMLGVLIGWMLAKQGKRRPGLIAALAGLAAAGAVVTTASIVTTTRERLRLQTAALVEAAAQADLRRLEELLASDATLRVFWVQRSIPRAELLGLVEQYPGGQTPVKSWTIDDSAASIDGSNVARTQIHVVTRSPAATMYDVPMGSWWRIDWRADADGTWRIWGIECQQGDWGRGPGG